MTSSRTKWVAVAIGVIVVVALIVTFNKPHAASNITVGVILPLTGQYGSFGESIQKAMELSQKSLPDKKIRLIFEDDKYDAKSALSAYRKLTDLDHADIIVSFGSPTVEITKPLIAENDQIMFILGDELAHTKDNVFQLMPQGNGLYTDLGSEAEKRYKTIAVVYSSDNNLFKDDYDLFISKIASSTQVQGIPVLSTADMRAEAGKVMQSKADAYALFVPLEAGTKILKELSKYPNRPQLICDANIELSIKQYSDSVGTEPFTDCIATTMAETKTDEFVQQYKAAYASDPQFGSDYGYDTVQIIGELAGKDKKSWPTFLSDPAFHYSGMSGDITLDETGTRAANGELDVFKDGKFVRLAQ